MINRAALCLAAMALLVANKDVEKLERRTPALAFDSSKSPEAMAACLAEQAFNGSPTIVPEGAVRRVLIVSGGHVAMLFVVTPLTDGSHVELHRFVPVGGRSAEATCQ